MGFWRIVGYIFSIIWIIASLIVPYGIFTIWLPILFLYLLRKGAKEEAKRKDIHDMAELAREKDRTERIEQEKKRLEDLERWK